MGRVSDFFREQHITLDGQKTQKMLSLDREFEEMETERDALKTQNLKLQAKVNPLERDVERLQEQVKKNSASVHNLERDEIEIIKFIGDQKSPTSAEIAKGMNMHSVPVEHYLGRLVKKNYVVQSYVPTLGTMYSLGADGNAYLVENKLVPLTNSRTSHQMEQPSNPDGYVLRSLR